MSVGKNNKPELLAPAGNLNCALAAFDSGADAVYAGLSKFNARERTENFSIDEMSKLIAYARKINRKVYITMNTLIKESEVGAASSALAELAPLDPDAIIVQDLGIVRIIREYFPSLKIHASTQMGFHNSAGIKVAEKLGIERVILERQVTLEELRGISRKSPLELEVFVHGALCCSLSGKCLLSSWMGGFSGNRGKCKQPCRRRFFTSKGNGFFFSPKDLYSLEMLPELKKIGVASLKIEGRLRKPDYVTNVVSAYRMMLDATPDQEKELMPQARNLLSKSLGRKWSGGFSTEESMKNLIQHDSAGASGMLCGRVTLCKPNGFEAHLSRRVHVGDKIRVQPESGDEGSAITVTRLNVDGQNVKRAGKNSRCFIFCDKEVPFKGLVYKIGESYDDMLPRIEKLPLLKKGADISVKISSAGFEVSVLNAPSSPIWRREMEIEPAQKHPLSDTKVRDEFSSTASEKFRCGTTDVKIEGNYFLPASVLKETRREFWIWAEENISEASLTASDPAKLMRLFDDYSDQKGADCSGELEVIAVKPGGDMPGKRSGRHLARSIYDYNKQTDEVILPFFCPENRLENLKKAVHSAYKTGIRRFRVTDLFALPLLEGLKDITISASFPLPVCNSMAAQELKALGFARVQAWLEMERREIEILVRKSALPIEIYRYGRPPLLVTRAELPVEGKIKDARSNFFQVIKDKKSGLDFVFSPDVMSVPRVADTLDYYDLTNAYWNDQNRDTSTFNFDQSLV